jgi:hypothetical protein
LTFAGLLNDRRHVCFWGQTGHSAGWSRLPVLTHLRHERAFSL